MKARIKSGKTRVRARKHRSVGRNDTLVSASILAHDERDTQELLLMQRAMHRERLRGQRSMQCGR
jgi:hypothetical protein